MHGFWSTPTSKLISALLYLGKIVKTKIIAIFIYQNNLYILQVEIDLGGRVEEAHPRAQAQPQARALHEEHEE